MFFISTRATIAFAEKVARNLLGLGQHQLVVVVVQYQYLLLPHLIDLAGDDFADLLGILVEQVGLLEVHDPGGQVLSERQHGATAEVRELDLLGHLLAHFVRGVDLAGIRKRDLLVRILDRPVLDDRAVAPYFEIPFLGIDDHVEVLVRFVGLDQQMTKNVLENADHRALVDVFKLFEFRESAYEIEIIHVSM